MTFSLKLLEILDRTFLSAIHWVALIAPLIRIRVIQESTFIGIAILLSGVFAYGLIVAYLLLRRHMLRKFICDSLTSKRDITELRHPILRNFLLISPREDAT